MPIVDVHFLVPSVGFSVTLHILVSSYVSDNSVNKLFWKNIFWSILLIHDFYKIGIIPKNKTNHL